MTCISMEQVHGCLTTALGEGVHKTASMEIKYIKSLKRKLFEDSQIRASLKSNGR